MSAAAMANCAAGSSGVGPGGKRRTFFSMHSFYGDKPLLRVSQPVVYSQKLLENVLLNIRRIDAGFTSPIGSKFRPNCRCYTLRIWLTQAVRVRSSGS